MENALLTTKEVANELKVSERWVTKQIQDGRLQAISLGKSYRVYRQDLDAFIEKRRTQQKEE